jgi:site-specific recombinase XerD
VSEFFAWCERMGLHDLSRIEPTRVGAYVEQLGGAHVAPTVKQHLAAARVLFDWLVMGQVVKSNPVSVVWGPKHVVKRGKTPILSSEEARELFESIWTDTMVELRDCALIGVLIYSFARVSAAVSMRVEDYFPQGKRWWLRLHEKGGKEHTLPCHHELEAYLDAYMVAAGVDGEKGAPLFRTAFGKTGKITARRFDRQSAWYMVKRRAVGVSSRGVTVTTKTKLQNRRK